MTNRVPQSITIYRKLFGWLFVAFCCLQASAQTQRGNVYAVVVGISEYAESSKNLAYPSRDASEMYNLLRHHTSADRIVLLIDKHANRKNILGYTNLIFTSTKPNDVVIFFFSGHGYNGGFVAHDRELDYAELKQVFQKTKATRKFIFADACLSGGLRTNDRNTSRPSSFINVDNQKVCLFLSSRSDQLSWESYGLKNGYFTYFLLAGLRGGADRDRNRIITARELFDFVNPKVKQYSDGSQIPVMWGRFDDGMEILNWR